MGGDNADDFNTPVKKLQPIYNSRISRLNEFFKTVSDEKPDFYVRVPGRVNLIGEHIDYCGYSVCPMALQNDILIAVKANNNGVLKIFNVDKEYAESHVSSVSDISIKITPGQAPKWYTYMLCGIKGVLELMLEDDKPLGMLAVVCGNVPPAAGLSSSSALVCASAIAMAKANNVSVSQSELATHCAKSERYIGTQGGGMDQAIAILASEGKAKHICFNPLSTSDIQLPEGSVFVIAQSLAKLNKAETFHYNCRVTECRLGTQIIAASYGLSVKKITRPSQLQDSLNVSLNEMIDIVEKTLLEEPYSKRQICDVLKVSESELNETLPENILHIKEFKLRNRLLHIYNEAKRVAEFCQICQTQLPPQEAMKRLGALMNESHTSLKTLYECSHPMLDRLVDLSDGLAYGCRLTGAGWGGCVVALVAKENVQAYIEKLKNMYYRDNPAAAGQDLDSLVFATKPYGGACIFTDN